MRYIAVYGEIVPQMCGGMEFNVKKFTALILGAALLLSHTAYAAELSDWAKPGYTAANSAGLVPISIVTNKMTDNITREEFCEIVMNMYKSMKGADVDIGDFPFTDTDNEAVKKAYALGIIDGKTETEFYPQDLITRQEIAKILMRAINAADNETHVTAEDLERICSFEDFGEADDWAAADVAKSIKYEILNGVSATQIAPKGYATREQAVTIISRSMDAFSRGAVYYQQPEIDGIYNGMSVSEDFSVSWNNDGGAVSYSVILKDGGYNTVRTVPTKKNSANISVSGLTYNETYTVILAAHMPDGMTVYSEPIEVYYGTEQGIFDVNASLDAKYNRVFPNGIPFENEEDAAYNMAAVTVPVWRLAADGSKYSSTASLTVNRNLADEVVKIFTEIYNDPEQFPIKDAGGYNWRATAAGTGSLSQHSYGTCIDINYNENYYCYASNGQAITGSFWKPFENPYSIPENGSVVRIFAKYGWKWGGNAWTTYRDYMHFTYLGK